MAISLTYVPNVYDQGSRVSSHKVTFALTTNYPTGGEIVDLTAFGLIKVRDKSKIRAVWFNSSAGNNYSYAPGTTLANGKIQVWTAPGTEHAAAGYEAGYTGDTPYFVIEHLKD